MPRYKEEWWHTDSLGRRIGWMYPEVLQEWMNTLYGEDNATASRFAQDIGVDVSKVSRWLNGKDPVPKLVACLLNAWASDKSGAPIRATVPYWLPKTDSVNGNYTPEPKLKRGRPPKQIAP